MLLGRFEIVEMVILWLISVTFFLTLNLNLFTAVLLLFI